MGGLSVIIEILMNGRESQSKRKMCHGRMAREITTLLVLQIGYGARNLDEGGKGKEMNPSESL